MYLKTQSYLNVDISEYTETLMCFIYYIQFSTDFAVLVELNVFFLLTKSVDLISRRSSSGFNSNEHECLKVHCVDLENKFRSYSER